MDIERTQREASQPGAAFRARHGYWDARFDDALDVSPDFFEAYLQLSEAAKQAAALAPKVREFIGIAVNAATTNLHAPAIRNHIAVALRHGATQEEILEVLQLISALVVHSITSGARSMLAEYAANGTPIKLDAQALDAHQLDVKKRFKAEDSGPRFGRPC